MGGALIRVGALNRDYMVLNILPTNKCIKAEAIPTIAALSSLSSSPTSLNLQFCFLFGFGDIFCVIRRSPARHSCLGVKEGENESKKERKKERKRK